MSGTDARNLKELLANFKKEYGKTHPGSHANLSRLINENPLLKAQLEDAIKQGALTKIQLESSAKELNNANAHYHSGNSAIMLKPEALASRMPFDQAQLVFTLGHEASHAQHKAESTAAESHFAKKADEIAKQPGIRDYTEVMREGLAAYRQDEAHSKIAGWNAAMSHERRKNPHANPLDLAKKLLYDQNGHGMIFFDPKTGQPHPDIQFDKKGFLQATPANLEALGKHYFDRPANKGGGLGSAKTDYTNHYGVRQLSIIGGKEVMYEQQGKHTSGSYGHIDMDRLGLRQKELQAAHIDVYGTDHFNLVDSSDKNNLKTMHFYKKKEAPQGALKLTKGLPGESTQELDNTPSRISELEAIEAENEARREGMRRRPSPKNDPTKSAPKHEKPQSHLDTIPSTGADQRSDQITSQTEGKANATNATNATNTSFYGSQTYQDLIGEMLTVSQKSQQQQQNQSLGARSV
jgi:hypothetical protein